MKKAQMASMRLPLILANKPGEIVAIKVQAHLQQDGVTLATNAMAKPVSPFDGKVMKTLAKSEAQELPAETIKSLTHIATCKTCASELRASAEMSQVLAEHQFHCIVCGGEVTGEKIAPEAILASLKQELAADDDDEGSSKDDEDDRDDEDEDDAEEDDDDDEDDDKDDKMTKSSATVATTEAPAATTVTTETTPAAAPAAVDPAVTPAPAAATASETAPAAPAAEVTPEATPAATTVEAPAATVATDATAPVADTPAAPAAETTVTTVPAAEAPAVPAATVANDTAPNLDAMPSTEKPAAADATTEITPTTQETQPAAVAKVEVAATAHVDWKKAKVELVLSSVDNKALYHVFANGNPVARLVEANVREDLRGLFHTPKFVKAFTTIAQTEGLTPTVEKDFGLESVKTEVTVDQHVSRELDAAKAQAKAEIASTIAADRAKFHQSLSTAIVGTIKGLWGDKNPLRDGLVASLERIGVANPEALIDKALIASAQDFFKQAMTKADELASKSDETRNSIAETVATASFRSPGNGTAKTLAEKLGQGITPVIELAGSTNKVEAAVAPGKTEVTRTDRVENLRHKLFPAR